MTVTLSTPRFNVYVTPKPADFPITETYTPPPQESMLVEHLVQHGYAPVVDFINQPKKEDVLAMYGLVLTRTFQFMRCDQYDGVDPVLCIQWYMTPLSSEDLDIIMRFCSPFYGIGNPRSYVTKEEKTMIELGFMSGATPLQILRLPEFIGNHVQITPDQINILE